MIKDESESDFNNSSSDFQLKDDKPKHTETRHALGNLEEKAKTTSASPAHSITYNFRISRSKYANLIDESDIEWWTGMQAMRLRAGKTDDESTTTVGATTAADEAATAAAKAQETKSIKHFHHAPIHCPITDCKMIFLPNDLMLHYLSYHKTGPLPVFRVRESQRLIIALMPFALNIDDVGCLGLIAYAMKHVKCGLLSDLDLWLPQNLKLCPHFMPLSHDYPIFLLASIVPMDVFMRSRNKLLDTEEQNVCASMLVIWLAGAECNTQIAYTMTAFNKELTYSRSGIYEVRKLTATQNPYEFCSQDCNYFRLTFKELYALLRDEKTLKIEIVFPAVADEAQE